MTEAAVEQAATNMTLAVRSVSKTFGTRPVLKGVDLLVPGGQAVGLCGVNGAGKSTLLRILAGLLRPDRGSVQIRGLDLRDEAETAKRQLGMIAHASMVYPELTVMENLVFAARLHDLRDGARRADRLLAETGLAACRDDRAGILSRGLLQRLAVARALIHGPAVLLADEAFTGLDIDAVERLAGVFTRFVADGGTILMTTHDIRLGLRCCQRMIVLDGGRVALDRPTEEIHVESFVEDYVGYARRVN